MSRTEANRRYRAKNRDKINQHLKELQYVNRVLGLCYDCCQPSRRKPDGTIMSRCQSCADKQAAYKLRRKNAQSLQSMERSQ